MSDPVERATTLIRERYAEPLTLDDMADAAIISKFHFSRLFRQATGISPGRFLTAVRLHEAKRLLVTTATSVADISCLVGYTSLGTFTTRFTECIGLSPGKFRRFAELGMLGPVQPSTPAHGGNHGSLAGTVRAGIPVASGPIFMGVFDRPIPQGKPDACMMLPGVGEWLMDPVPEGDWHVMAVAPAMNAGDNDSFSSTFERPMLIAGGGPVNIRRNHVCSVDLVLRRPRPIDPPVLLTLPMLMNRPALADSRLATKAAV